MDFLDRYAEEMGNQELAPVPVSEVRILAYEKQ